MHTRRHLLVAVGAAGAAATAGCTGALGGSEATGDADRVRLGELSVQNNHVDHHQVQLAVEADDEMLHLGTYDLGSDGETRTIEGVWTDDAGGYRIHARLDDGEIQSADVTEEVGSSTDCVRVLVRIDASGELAVWNGSDCGTDTDAGEGEDLENV